MTKMQVVIATAAFLIAAQVRASMYNLTFNIQGNIGSGVLTATDNHDGTLLVTAASVLVTAGSWSSTTPYILAPNGYNYGFFGPYGQSSEGHFTGGGDLIYDNIIYPNKTPSLDNDGLAFWTASGLNGRAFNIFGNAGATDYEFAAGDNSQPNPLGFADVRGGTVSISAVPETRTMVSGVGALGLLLLGAGVHSKRSVLRIGK
jgi:hypothetical protein